MASAFGRNGMYRYQALNDERQQIRLVKLEKRPSGHPPRCSIHAFDLASAPKYIALSYTWGPPDPSHQIYVDEKTFRVRKNLYNFLCSFQTGSAVKTDITYVYIDQICINQDDVQERNSQVRLMSDIYTQSSLVVVWLGSDPKMVRAAYAIDDDMDNADELHFPTANIRTLLSSEYFTRIWIVQEVSLAREIRILIGDYELRWAAAQFVAERIDSMKPANSLRTLNDLFKENDPKKVRQLDKVVGKYSVHECQDPRDKVYGLLGMVPAWQRPVVDYTKSMHQVLLDVIPVVLYVYWRNKPTEVITNTLFYGHFRVYLENMLRLAWNMGFPDHDQRGLVLLFQEIVDVEDNLSREIDSTLTLADVIDGFGYETVDPPVIDEREGVLMGRWWMKLGDDKYYYECRTSSQPLRQLSAWRFLSDVQLIKK
ncbi:HET-domain-containing protein [Nemania sp. NC0429]|nr:HET-domain-containing protein [Nemania sp. NC0429]